MDLTEVNDNLNRHPWETSRANFILGVLDQNVDFMKPIRMLDIGCGDLFFSLRMKEKKNIEIDAVDLAFDDEEVRYHGIQKIKHLDKVMHKKYDLICALDVLEHVENDEGLLNRLIDMLKPDGTLIITVPAFQILYSYHDLRLKHLRRYHRGHLNYLIDHPERINILESFYFYHLLVYARFAEKFLQFFLNLNPKKKHSNEVNAWKYPESHPLTRLLSMLLSLDALACRALAKWNIRLPGLSLCMVIRKNKNDL